MAGWLALDVAAEAEANENEATTEDANAQRWGWEAGGGLHRGVGRPGGGGAAARALTGGRRRTPSVCSGG
jgi:hypothetical protein